MADDDHVQSGRLKRLSRLAYLTARTTGDLLAQSARRKLGGESSADLRKAAERILGTLGELKGAALKLGQALAMDPTRSRPRRGASWRSCCRRRRSAWPSIRSLRS